MSSYRVLFRVLEKGLKEGCQMLNKFVYFTRLELENVRAFDDRQKLSLTSSKGKSTSAQWTLFCRYCQIEASFSAQATRNRGYVSQRGRG